MSWALATQSSTSCRSQMGIVFEAFANSSKRPHCNNYVRFKDGAHNFVTALGSSDCTKKIKSNSKTPTHGNEKTTSRRLEVVRNATPTAAGSPGLLIPLSTVGTDHDDDSEENKFADALNQLLIKKSKKKKKAAAEGEIAIAAKSFDIKETKSKPSDVDEAASSLSSSSPSNYDNTLLDLIDQLESVRLHALGLERWHAPQLKKVHRKYLASARNLLHYVAFRSLDIADLQERLASSGLASLEGCEAHTLASVNSISSILRSLLHGSDSRRSRSGDDDVISFEDGNALLSRHAEVLLGPSPPGRKTLVMVTLPSEAAEDDALIRDLFQSGMNIARINCAHDNPAVWKKMVQKVRFFSQLLETPCRISFDLAGPKLRTGPLQPGPSVLKIKPSKDSLGEVVAPACVWVAEAGMKPSEDRVPDAIVPIVVPSPKWTKKVKIGDVIKFRDARGRSRELRVVEKFKTGVFAECRTVSYIKSGCEFVVAGCKKLKLIVGKLPEMEQAIVLRAGDELVLKRDGSILGTPARVDKAGNVVAPASVACTLENVFEVAAPGEPVKFDDGRIGGVVTAVARDEIRVTITDAGDAHKGRKLRGEKAINFPESYLSISGLTPKDAADLDFVAAHADFVALSFVNGPADVRALQGELARRGAGGLGVVVKIETESGLQRLPGILLQAMQAGNPVGVMVARGDMAVECGWQRLAEIQDQILLICEAAHVPSVWATQVLEGLAKSGLPSRAEITDAASGSRAECVMLNKGPYILQAVASLDDILRREACHRRKNQSVLHPLQNLGI